MSFITWFSNLQTLIYQPSNMHRPILRENVDSVGDNFIMRPAPPQDNESRRSFYDTIDSENPVCITLLYIACFLWNICAIYLSLDSTTINFWFTLKCGQNSIDKFHQIFTWIWGGPWDAIGLFNLCLIVNEIYFFFSIKSRDLLSNIIICKYVRRWFSANTCMYTFSKIINIPKCLLMSVPGIRKSSWSSNDDVDSGVLGGFFSLL